MNKYILLLCMTLFSIETLKAQLITGMDVAVTNTEQGKVRGFINNGIYTYKGIPYAKAERFHAPQKPDSWDGVRSSMTWGPVCPLETPTTRVQDESEFVFNHDWGYDSEDCLVLNVWTPSINDGKKRPVMFWIHGGGFTAGSSQELPSYHGENLSKKGDVVVVSVNHRLNVIGFLDLSEYGEEFKSSANNSMLDLQAALEWVQENIENFGGDPDNVTIFGQSGGGAKVNTLMAMPGAKGLFHKAVNQSGAFRSAMLEKETTKAVTAETIKELGITDDIAENLKKTPYLELAAAGRKALKTIENQMRADGKEIPGFGLGWGPSRDGMVLPYQILSDEALSLSKDVPLMIGTVKNEFMSSLFMGLSGASEEKVMEQINTRHGEKATDYIAAVKKAYPNDTEPTDLIDVDVIFRPGAVAQANMKSAISGGAPVYMYLFTWQSPVLDGKYKAFHCMELPFVFDNIEKCKEMTGGGAAAHELADKVSQAWINFARSGNPNHDGLPKWPAYNDQNTATMHFDNQCKVMPQMDKDLFELLGLN